MRKIIVNFLNLLGLSDKKIVREDSHGNDIEVVYLSKKKIYRKISETSYGQNLLDCEHKGLQWYLKRVKKNKSKIIKKFTRFKNYSEINIKKFDGVKISYENSLIKNEKYLKQFILHYRHIWPKKKRVPCHGDMTFDNIIFNGNKILIIDWEYFKKSGEQWGFDLAYLILSAASFPYYRDEFIPEKDQGILRKLWKKLIFLGLKGKIVVKPIDVFKNTFNSKLHWKKIIRKSPKKLFPYILSKKFINHIHFIIN